MTYKTFEEFLQFQHAEGYMGLDDDMSDSFDRWLGQLDGEDYIEFADEYAKLKVEESFNPVSDSPRHGDVLRSFVYYCSQAPTLRFWQALLNWSGKRFIYISNTEPCNLPAGLDFVDPYNWEGKNG